MTEFHDVFANQAASECAWRSCSRKSARTMRSQRRSSIASGFEANCGLSSSRFSACCKTCRSEGLERMTDYPNIRCGERGASGQTAGRVSFESADEGSNDAVESRKKGRSPRPLSWNSPMSVFRCSFSTMGCGVESNQSDAAPSCFTSCSSTAEQSAQTLPCHLDQSNGPLPG